MDLKDFAAIVVNRFDLRNIEPLGDNFRSTDTARLIEFREAMEKTGAHTVKIALDGGGSYYGPDPAKRKKATERGKKCVDIAAALGSRSISTKNVRSLRWTSAEHSRLPGPAATPVAFPCNGRARVSPARGRKSWSISASSTSLVPLSQLPLRKKPQL